MTSGNGTPGIYILTYFSRKIILCFIYHTITRPSEANDASFSDFFIFHFFDNFFIFSLSSSFLPPRPSFLLDPPSSSSLLPPHPSFFFVQHGLNHLESVKVHLSSILTKALRTDGPTNRRTRQFIEMRTHLK